MSTLQPEDHILVRTVQGEIKSLMIHDIIEVTALIQGRCRIRHHLTVVGKGNTVRVIDVLEDQDVFLQRCDLLLKAIEQQNEQDINRHFAPGVQGEP